MTITKTPLMLVFVAALVVSIGITAVYAQSTAPLVNTETSSTLASDANFNGTRQMIGFNLVGTTVTCPDDTTVTTGYKTYSGNTYAFTFSNELLTESVAILPVFNVPHSTAFKIIEGRVSDNGENYILRGMLVHATSTCPTADDIFDIEIRGTCNGSIFSLTTTRANGFSAIASGDQIRGAGCLSS